jgi:hypothetical protein
MARDTVVIALNPDLVGPSYALGDTQFVLDTTVDLGPAVANGELRRLYVAVRRVGIDPPVAVDSTLVAFDPRLEVLDQSPVENPVDLQLRTAGVELLRFALQRGDLAASPWFDPTPVAGDTASSASFEVGLAEGVATRQLVWVEASSDFGFTRVDSVAVVPASVAPQCTTAHVCFTIEGGSSSTPAPVVRLDMHMSGASRMRFSETLPLSALPWIPYADTLDFALSPGLGEKPIHAQFANAFDAFGVAASDTILRVGETAPRER